MVSLEGLELSHEEVDLLSRPSVGALILFSRNYSDRAQLKALVESIRAVKPHLLIAVDQEGGRVQRFKEGFLRLPPLAALGSLYAKDVSAGLEAAELCGWAMAVELLDVGLDFSFAPVLDVQSETSRVIGDRALSSDTAIISALSARYIKGMNKAGMAATGKHFPGHGTVDGDSHVELPIDDRSLAEIEACDLQPFEALSNHLGGIMPAHVIYPQVDDKCAGFSSIWLQDVLRARLGFDGVIFSDDLTMDAAHSAGSIETRANLALSAGCDMVLVCNDNEAARQVADFIEENALSFAAESNVRLAGMAANFEAHNPNYRSDEQWDRAKLVIDSLLNQSF